MSSLSITSSLNDTSKSSDIDYIPTEREKNELVPCTTIPVPNTLSEMDFRSICKVADRLDLSEVGSALITNAVFETIGLIHDDAKALVVTPGFMRNVLVDSRTKAWQTSVDERTNNVELLQCFSFDGKKSRNAVMVENPHGKTAEKHGTLRMENVAIVKQPEMEPLGFISTLNGTSSAIFKQLWDYLNPGGQGHFNSLIAISADGTNVNTGCNAGVITLFEWKVGRSLHRIICLFHLNELVLKHIIIALDGPSHSESKLSGVIGKKITAENFTISKIVAFEAISLGDLPSGVDKLVDLRGDQRQLLDLGLAIAAGKCPTKIAFKKPPAFSFCRWLSAAIRILLVYISTTLPSNELRTLVYFIQRAYIPMWFRVRCESSWQNGSRHLFALLDTARATAEICQNTDIIRVTQNVIVNNGYFAHPENILLSMITDSDPEARKEGYFRILKIRQCGDHSDPNVPSIRKFVKPKKEDYNFDAVNYRNLLKSDKYIHEPPFTQRINQQILQEYAKSNYRLVVPDFKCHTQDTERFVGLMASSVTRVSGTRAQNAIMRLKFESRRRNSRVTKRLFKTYKSHKC